jgi:CheY-like chemotaxis protein
MNPPGTILLVEDNDDDVFLMRRALSKAGCSHGLQIAGDGQQALDYFQAAGNYQDRSKYALPGLVFLDLKLPYVHGFEVLAWLRSQREFREVPVAILTSSPEDRDRKKAYELGANLYLVKPPEIEPVRDALALFPAPAAVTPPS